MAAHVHGCTWDGKRWTEMGPGCAAPEDHLDAAVDALPSHLKRSPEEVAEIAAKAEACRAQTNSPLVRFAIEELKRAGAFDGDADYGGAAARDVLDLVKLFSLQGHSGGSAWVVTSLFNDLVRYRPISPLTNDPAEWNDVADFSGGEPCWQSRRRHDAFSRDGGKTYYLLDDPWPWWRRKLGLGRKTRRAENAPAGKAVA